MQSATHHNKSAYRPEIDGLRAFAVLSVVLFHAAPSWMEGGFVGVDVFFVISGFLITAHIFEKLDEGKFSFADFFARRIRRIFPALILVMASSLAFGWFVLLADEYAQLGKHVASGAAFIVNFILVDESGYFDNVAETKPMLHLWSLAVEEQFYIVWPLVLWVAWKRQFNLLFVTISVAIVSFYINLRFVISHPIDTFFWPVGRFWELLSGSALAWVMLYQRDFLSTFKLRVDQYLVRLMPIKHIAANGSTITNSMSCIGLLLLGYSVLRINESLPFPSTWALIPILGALLVISAGSTAWFNRVLLMNPIAVWFGLISYPLYLWHWPILSYLQILEGDLPHLNVRIAAVVVSILLAWATYNFVEKPIRFGAIKKKIHASLIALGLFIVGLCGLIISITDLSELHVYEDNVLKRKGLEHAYGDSLAWYMGKDDWIFLGNAHHQTVAKLKLAKIPTEEMIGSLVAEFTAAAEAAAKSNTQVALLVGSNKSSVYPEFLPAELLPAQKRYSTFFTDRLVGIPNLVVQDPTDALITAKSDEGMIYYRADSHWNTKGAYIAYTALLRQLNLNFPSVQFDMGPPRRGDLVYVSKLNEFPLYANDNWQVTVNANLDVVREEFAGPNDSFGWQGVVKNHDPLNDMSVWVIGDSFVDALRPYLEATFKQVRYIGHRSSKIKTLPSELESATEKPDLVLILKVERSF